MSQLKSILLVVIVMPMLLALADLSIGQVAGHQEGYLGLMRILKHLVSIACKNDDELAQGIIFVWSVFCLCVGFWNMFPGWSKAKP